MRCLNRIGNSKFLEFRFRSRQFTGYHRIGETQALWAPSQNGLFADWPQRQRPMAVRPAQAEGTAFGIEDLEVALDSDRAVVVHDDLVAASSLLGTRAGSIIPQL